MNFLDAVLYLTAFVFNHDVMDHTIFRVRRDKGFLSVHTKPDIVFDLGFTKIGFRIDAWHTAKKIIMAIIIYSWVGIGWEFLALACYNFVLHQFVFFHGLFKLIPEKK